MIKSLRSLSDNICVLVGCVSSAYMDNIVRDVLKQRFDVNVNYSIGVKTASELRQAKSLITVPPMLGNRWLITIDAKELAFADLVDFFKLLTSNAICYIRCDNYGVFKKIATIKVLNEHTANVVYRYYDKLTASEIREVYKYVIGQGTNRLTDDLLKYVCSAYNYDVGAVCELFSQLKSGVVFDSKEAIIEAIGVGGNTIAYTVVQLLSVGVNTEKGYRRATKKIFGLIKDLSTKYTAYRIYSSIEHTVDRFITLKEMFIAGTYRDRKKDFPERFGEQEIAQLKKLGRYDWLIKDRVSMEKLLCLKMCILKHKHFDTDVSLIACVTDYLYMVQTNCFRYTIG